MSREHRQYSPAKGEPKVQFLRPGAPIEPDEGNRIRDGAGRLWQRVSTRKHRRIEDDVMSQEQELGAFIQETFALDIVESLENDERYEPTAAVDNVQRRMNNLREELSQPLEHPTWGPKLKYKDFKRGTKKSWNSARDRIARYGDDFDADERGADRSESRRTLHDQDKAIAYNWEQSRRYSRYGSLYLATGIFCAFIVLAALFVDFAIIQEFWQRALANEFLDVPAAFSTSIIAKSLQVLFATIAIHLLIRHLPKSMIVGFTSVLFLLTVIMLFGLGFLLADSSIPVENAALLDGESDEGSLGSALADYGIPLEGTSDDVSSNGTINDAVIPEWAQEFLNIGRAVGWLIALTSIFFVVASVGALFLLWTEKNIRNFIIARDFSDRSGGTTNLRRLEALNVHLTSRN